MSPAPYPDFRWLLRPLRALPIVAIAALVGGMIGGFSVFALDLALTASPSHDASAEVGKINAEKAANVAATAPAAGTSAPPVPEQTAADNRPPSPVIAPQNPRNPAQGQTPAQGMPQSQAQTAPQIAVTPPLSAQQATWPDALSREHSAAPTTTAPATAAAPTNTATAPQPAASQPSRTNTASTLRPAASQPAMAASRQGQALEAAHADSTSGQRADSELRKPIPAKRYVTVKRKVQGAPSDGAEATARTGRPVYDLWALRRGRAARRPRQISLHRAALQRSPPGCGR